jgi:hypothetical protein
MYPESLGVHAVKGNFNLVSVKIVEGRYLPPKKGKKITPMHNSGVFYREVREQFFDKTKIDEEVAKELKKLLGRKPSENVASSMIQDAMAMASAMVSVSGDPTPQTVDSSTRRIERLSEYPTPALLEWDANPNEGEAYPLPLFIKRVIPFLRTREWMFNRYEQMRRAETDRFMSAIVIRRRPAMQAVVN